MRAAAIFSQLGAGFTLCSTAKLALRMRQGQTGRRALEKAKHITEHVQKHLAEPRHVPADLRSGLEDELEKLKKEISILASGFDSLGLITTT